jgi:phage terminase large subunit
VAVKKQAEKKNSATNIGFDLGTPNSEPQWQYFTATNKYICYGGSRGGGKSWSTQRKSALLALNYEGIKILIVRREYSDMENSIIDPILAALPTSVYTYNKTDHMMTFQNGSTIKFGNMPGYGAAVAGRYQGQEYDVVFLEEATQFLENEFRGLAAIVRGTNNFPKRMYLTCNPKPTQMLGL